MKALLVFAHPSTTSYNYALKEAIKSGLTEAGYDVIESDLYRQNFNAALDREDFPTYTEENFCVKDAVEKAALDQVFSQEIQDEMNKVIQSDFIIFQFPVWWFTCPAIMSGWLQRVFPTDSGIPGHSLAGKKVLISVTTGPGLAIYIKNKTKPFEIILCQFLNFFRRYGCNILPIHVIYNVNKTTYEEKQLEIEELRSYARNINNI